ncbi:hypothetical protein [Kitasatospora sp. NPDC018619]|uniref:hypothetical protein n=1 Tax=unclassified Kitasatospora TaxID=2633591 RepID=UPI0037AC3834
MLNNLTCGRCGTAAADDPASADGWNARWASGRLAELICPSCQTPLDVAEAEVNDAELTVARQDGGTFVTDPVICMTGTAAQPGTILYGEAHLRRIARTGRAEPIPVIERLPEATRCGRRHPLPALNATTPPPSRRRAGASSRSAGEERRDTSNQPGETGQRADRGQRPPATFQRIEPPLMVIEAPVRLVTPLHEQLQLALRGGVAHVHRPA